MKEHVHQVKLPQVFKIHFHSEVLQFQEHQKYKLRFCKKKIVCENTGPRGYHLTYNCHAWGETESRKKKKRKE